MATVASYLHKLLYQYDCVVVPELGAFLTHYEPARFTEAAGLYVPPRKRVAFNEALRLDDGILANYVMLHEPLTRDEAGRYVGAFVADLRRQVEQTGRFELASIGTFTRNEESKIQFDPGLRTNFYGEAYGMSGLSARLVNQQPQPGQALEAVPMTTALGPVRVPDEDVTYEPLRRSLPYWRVAAAALLVGTLGVVSYFSVLKPGQPLQSSLNPAGALHTPAILYKRMTKPAERPAPQPAEVRSAAPVAPAMRVAERLKAVPPATLPTAPVVGKPVVTAPVAAAPAKSALAVPIAKPVPVKPVVTVRPKRTSPYFTVIAGSFSSRWNAFSLQRRLRRSGYSDAFVLPPGGRGQLYKVAAAGSANRTEALTQLVSISTLTGTPAWIYKN